jgi:glycine/D-amino acid oxidase-like deaminating enzyme
VNITRKEFLKFSIGTGGALLSGCVPSVFADDHELTFDKNNSYWSQKLPSANSPLNENLNVDVAIIGGGYTGLSTALHLAKCFPHLSIIVLEALHVGNGASGRHGGMILTQPGLEAFEIANDLKTHVAMYEMTVNSIASLKQLVMDSGHSCDLQLSGYVHAYFDDEDRTYYEQYVKKVRKAGLPLEFWNRNKVRDALGTNIFAGGVFDPNGGSVHAVQLIRILKLSAEKAGVRIYENSPVIKINEGRRNKLLIGHKNSEVQAKAVVVATNGYSCGLGLFENQVMPLHVQTAVTPVLTEKQLRETGWRSRLPWFDSRENLFHLVLTPDNRIVIGGGNAEYFYKNTLHYSGDLKSVSQMMLSELKRFYPSLKNISFEYVWNGIIGISYEEVPAAGIQGEYNNIYYGLAYNGHGVIMAYTFGAAIASMFQGKSHPWFKSIYNEPLAYLPPKPLRWLGVKAIMQYLKWKE